MWLAENKQFPLCAIWLWRAWDLEHRKGWQYEQGSVAKDLSWQIKQCGLCCSGWNYQKFPIRQMKSFLNTSNWFNLRKIMYQILYSIHILMRAGGLRSDRKEKSEGQRFKGKHQGRGRNVFWGREKGMRKITGKVKQSPIWELWGEYSHAISGGGHSKTHSAFLKLNHDFLGCEHSRTTQHFFR